MRPERHTPLVSTEQSAGRTTTGIGPGDGAWVRHVQPDGTVTTYRVYPTVDKPEYLPRDYCVGTEEGPDVLDHDDVRRFAHDAFIDAFGGR